MHVSKSDQALIVYLDFKSPYAYLAIEPTRRLEQELGIQFDWRPFVLDIPSYLGSASLSEDGQVATQNRSDEQWKAIKYAYYDCRRYASISNLTIRGTTKIWDTNLAASAMLWVREYALKQLPQFIDLIFGPFWKRELDIEDAAAIDVVLEQCSLDPKQFHQWHLTTGRELNARLQAQAFDAGIYGVPSYVIDGDIFFGREHLPRIAWLLGDKCQAAPDVANLLPKKPLLGKPGSVQIIIGLDQSFDSVLATPLLKSLLDRTGHAAIWTKIKSQNLEGLIPPADAQSRTELHRNYRNQTTRQNIQRYGNREMDTGDLNEQLSSAIESSNIKLNTHPDSQLDSSPFPGVVIKINDEVFIGRQHLPLIEALIS